jgi:hypothetical protein
VLNEQRADLVRRPRRSPPIQALPPTQDV